jgi:hypothetical protein
MTMTPTMIPKMIPMLMGGLGLLSTALLPAGLRASGLLTAMAGDAPACDAPEVKIALLDQIYGRALTQARHVPRFALRHGPEGQASLFQNLDDLRNKPLLLIEASAAQGAAGHRPTCVATIAYRLPGGAMMAPAQVGFTTAPDRKLGETAVTLQSGWQNPVMLAESMALDRYLHES